MIHEPLLQDVSKALQGAAFELSDLGLYCRRDTVAPGALKRAEAALCAHGPVRVLDFKHDASSLIENIIPAEGASIGDYEGVVAPSGHRVFRVDHHYELPSLRDTSSTPLVLRWIRALHDRGRTRLLEELARSRYLADHADTDILLSNYIAGQAASDVVLQGPLREWLCAAALRNDYIVLPQPRDEPYASRIYYACVGIEDAILDGKLTFEEAQRAILPQLRAWVTGDVRGLDPEIGRRLDAWEAEKRAEEDATLRMIDRWVSQGRMRWELGGRAAILDAEKKIDNADLYLYFLRKGRRPVVQALMYPERDNGTCVVKLRSHGGFNLYPLFERLNRLIPGAAFDGRAAAGGSRPMKQMDWTAFVRALSDAIEHQRPS
jgi:hypothetical protein